MFKDKFFSAFAVKIFGMTLLVALFGCSANSVNPVASYVEPQSVGLIYNISYTHDEIMEDVKQTLSRATRIKDKQRYTQTTDPRVQRPDLVLGQEVFKECVSPDSCIITLVFHKGQFLGETKRYNASTNTVVPSSGLPKISGEATTKQIIRVPVEISKSSGDFLLVGLYFDGVVETDKYVAMFGLTNIVSGSTYSPLLRENNIVDIYEAMAKISPRGAVLSKKL